jgi:hypothetical protein
MMGEARSGIIIGLDTSLLRTAYAIIVDDELLAFGTIHTKEGLADRRDAWKTIRDEARRIERITHTHTRAVVIEDAWLGPNRLGSLNHARCVGHAEAFAIHAFPYALIERVMPQSWRALLNLPKKGKEGAMRYSERVCEISNRQSGWAGELDQDSADAICIAYAAREAYSADSLQD